MWLVWNTAFFALLVTCAQATCSTAALASRSCVIATALKPLLSKHAKISFNASTDVRWSEYHAPNPDAIVNIATELDVVATVNRIFSLRQSKV